MLSLMTLNVFDCREKLPEVEKIVLVITKTKKGVVSWNRAYIDAQGFWHGSGSMSCVIGWAEVPEAAINIAAEFAEDEKDNGYCE